MLFHIVTVTSAFVFTSGISSALNVMLSSTLKIASAVSSDVKQATPFSTDSRLILKPSLAGCFPLLRC